MHTHKHTHTHKKMVGEESRSDGSIKTRAKRSEGGSQRARGKSEMCSSVTAAARVHRCEEGKHRVDTLVPVSVRMIGRVSCAMEGKHKKHPQTYTLSASVLPESVIKKLKRQSLCACVCVCLFLFIFYYIYIYNYFFFKSN